MNELIFLIFTALNQQKKGLQATAEMLAIEERQLQL
jgi:hypothetical protein